MTATKTAGTTAAGSRWPGEPIEIARELTLVGLSAASIVTLGRLFAGSGHVGPLVVHALVAHALFVGVRRVGRSLALAATAAPLVALTTAGLVFAPATTTLGVPTGTTLEVLRGELDAAVALFGEAPTPTEPIDGFLLLAAAAIWVCAFVADWAAMRLRVPLEALLPSATVFVFVAVIADGEQRAWPTAIGLVCALVFLLVHRTSERSGRSAWVVGARGRGQAAVVTTGAVLVVAAVAVASLAAPSLPGAGSQALIELEPGGDSPQSRTTVSPLVDIRRRLVDQQDIQLFTVESDTPAYWRLTSLDAFDGQIWSSSGSYGTADGELDRPVESAPQFSETEQRFRIANLSTIWLPVAFEPRSVSSEIDTRFDEHSSTLIVDTDITDGDGAAYAVRSVLPVQDPTALRAAGTAYPVEILDDHLDLPADLPQSVRDEARRIAAGAATPYDAVLALQNHLRTFTYDLGAPSGHSANALEQFLLVDQIGYCEQFAGAFAAMARSLNIPARVAVGFTPGVETSSGTYEVSGLHAHAWPEVFFPGLGWVDFEPTPGRGAPGSQRHTGVPFAQATSDGDPNTATTLAPTTTTSTPVGEQPGDEAGPAAPGDTTTTTDGQAGPDDERSGGTPRVVLWAAIVFGIVAAVAAAYVALALGVDRARHRRRERLATTAADRIRLAWDESVAHLAHVGLVDRPEATHTETARQAADLLPAVGAQARTVGALAEAALYGPDELDDDAATEAADAATGIAVAVRERTSTVDRAKPALDPRQVLGVGPIRRIGRDPD